jgi:6-phosphofructokinase 1
LIPEIPYRIESICRTIEKRSRRGRRFSIIAVSEGVRLESGEQVIHRTVPDSFEKTRLGGVSTVLAEKLEAKTGLECRAVVLGHVQRGGTPTPFDRVLATRFGHEAVKLIETGKLNSLVAWRAGKITSVPLTVIKGQRLVPSKHSCIEAARAVGTCFGDD